MQLWAEDGCPLAVSQWGDAEVGTVLLLPDWLQSRRVFHAVGLELARAGWQVIALDPRGAGHSGRPERGYGLARDAADAALVVEMMVGGPVTVVGTGYGALVGLTMPRDMPHRVSRLILVAPSVALPGSPASLRLLAAAIEDAARLQDFVASSVTVTLDPDMLRRGAEDMARTTKAAADAQLQALASADWRALAAQVACPWQVAVGESDGWGGPRAVREQLVTTPTVWRSVGHFPVWEAPQLLVEFINAPGRDARWQWGDEMADEARANAEDPAGPPDSGEASTHPSR